jgi:hypothetical protein
LILDTGYLIPRIFCKCCLCKNGIWHAEACQAAALRTGLISVSTRSCTSTWDIKLLMHQVAS